MKGVKNILLSVDSVDKNLFYELRNIYGDEEIRKVLEEIVSLKKDFSSNDERYNYQVFLWDRYGYCFCYYHYYPFFDDILNEMKNNSFGSSDNLSFDTLSLSEEVTYGFQLLFRHYFPYFGKDNYLDVDKFYLPLCDQDKKCVIDLFFDFYEKYPPKSHFDKSFLSFLKVENERIGDIVSSNNDVLCGDLQLYFDYREAVHYFTNGNLGLIGKVCSSYYDKSSRYEDYFQDGFLGLVRACDYFDVRYGYKFATYSFYWIHQFIGRNSKNTHNMVRLPIHIIEKYSKIKRTIADYEFKHGSEPSLEELSNLVNISVDEINSVLSNFSQFYCKPLQTPITDDDEKTLEDVIEDVNSNFENKVIHRMMMDDIMGVACDILSDRELDIIMKRYGFSCDHPMTLQEISDIFGFSRERARQIEINALKKLRRNRKIKSYSDDV